MAIKIFEDSFLGSRVNWPAYIYAVHAPLGGGVKYMLEEQVFLNLQLIKTF